MTTKELGNWKVSPLDLLLVTGAGAWWGWTGAVQMTIVLIIGNGLLTLWKGE